MKWFLWFPEDSVYLPLWPRSVPGPQIWELVYVWSFFCWIRFSRMTVGLLLKLLGTRCTPLPPHWPPQVSGPAPGPPALMNSDNTYNWWPPKDSSMQAVVIAGYAHRNRSTLWKDKSSRRVSAVEEETECMRVCPQQRDGAILHI